MKPLFASAAILALTNAGALAADASVIGDWLVKDGYGHIRIDNCGGKMWGIVAWEKTPGFDNEKSGPGQEGPAAARHASADGAVSRERAGKMDGRDLQLAERQAVSIHDQPRE